MITIVGAGALGSHTVLFLRNILAEHRVQVVDFDRIELKNTMAQFHTQMGKGKNKSVALGHALSGMFGRHINPVPFKLTEDNASTILQDPDLIIDCTDNIEARKLIQDYHRRYDFPCLHGALSADGQFARIMWSEHFTPDAEGEEGEATCEDGEALPFFAFVAAYLAIEVQRFLNTGKKGSYQLSPAGVLRLA